MSKYPPFGISFWQVQNIEKPKTSFAEVLSCFAAVKAIKDSIETIRCTYQAKLNQH